MHVMHVCLEGDVHVEPLDLLEHALLLVVRADAGESLDLLALVVLAEDGGELLLLLVGGGAVLGVERLGHLVRGRGGGLGGD